MTDSIKTPVGTLQAEKRYNLVLKHGSTERPLENVVVHQFHTEPRYDVFTGKLSIPSELRFEVIGEQTIGFLPDHVLSFEALKD